MGEPEDFAFEYESIWDALWEAYGDWEAMHLESYSRIDDPDLRAKLADLDARAPLLLEHALRLTIAGGFEPEFTEPFRTLLRAYGTDSLVRDRWSLGIAADAISRLESAVDRVAELMDAVLVHDLDERTGAYLARVARLYVYGFDVEALAMCRAAMDVAMQEALPDERLQEAGFMKVGREYSLATRVAAAVRLGWFDKRQEALAHSLRLAANEALHVAPGFLNARIPTSLDAVKGLADLLLALERGRGRGGK